MIDANVYITYFNHNVRYFNGEKRVKLACKPDIGDEIYFCGPAEDQIFTIEKYYFADNGVLEVVCHDHNYDYVDQENLDLESYLDAEEDLKESGVKITRTFEYNKLAETYSNAKA